MKSGTEEWRWAHRAARLRWQEGLSAAHAGRDRSRGAKHPEGTESAPDPKEDHAVGTPTSSGGSTQVADARSELGS